MSAALDAAQVLAPGAAALGGAYLGARWRARSTADVELRIVVDEAVVALQKLARPVGNARSFFITDGANTSDDGHDALVNLDEAFFEAQEVRDRLLVRTAPGGPVPVHYLNALLAVGRAFDALKKPAFWPNEDSHAFPDLGEVITEVRESERDYGKERGAFLEAAQALVGPRPGLLKRVVNRVKRSDRSE